ncbi:MAG: IS481 family transposase [Rhodospirillales bacterium]|nr:IS481 family transposase [Rhodospirillales bacterium]
MNVHKNARLTPCGRGILISRLERGEHPEDVATAMGISASTVYKWRRRYRAEGDDGLRDRSSRPRHSPKRTPADLEAKVVALRKQRRIYHLIATEVGVARATVGRILTRHGLNRWRDLEPARPENRYEYDKPGGMIHIDIKKLGRFYRTGHRFTAVRGGAGSRGVGWEFVHVCIDDHSRLGIADVFPNERGESAVAFLEAAVAWYARMGITVERVMTDNGGCYISLAFKDACKRLGLKHIRTKPYTPRTNGKAERFIQSCLREWAYAKAYQSSDQRARELPRWLHHYNWHRPHAGIKGKQPISRSGIDVNNLMRLHS